MKKIILFTVLFLFPLVSCYGYNLLFEDDFESGTIGAFPDGPNGSSAVWLGPFEETVGLSYDMKVSNTLAYAGSNSFFMQTDTMSYWIRAVASFNQSSDTYVTIDYYVRITNLIPDENRCAIIKYIDASNKIAAQITFNDKSTPGVNDNHSFYASGGVEYNDSGSLYELDTWYHILIVANQQNKTYTIYIDDMANPVVSNVAYYDNTAGYITQIW